MKGQSLMETDEKQHVNSTDLEIVYIQAHY